MDSTRPGLDIDFYSNFYDDLSGLTAERVTEHWLQNGEAEGRWANWTAFLADNPEIAETIPPNFSAPLYRYLNPDLNGSLTHDWQFVMHYVQSGRQEGRAFEVETSDFLSSLYPAAAGGTAGAAQAGDIIYASLDAMLVRNGIRTSTFISHFSVDDYMTWNAGAGLENATQCLRHFAEQGRAALAPISADHWFDPAFYAEIVPGAPPDPPDAYLHWLNTGLPAGHAPNPQLFLKMLGLRDIAGGMPSSFDETVYLGLNPDLRETVANRWEALRHLVEHGIVEARLGRPTVRQALDVYLAAADHLAIANRLPEAKSVYELILIADPENGFATQHLADCLFKQGQYFAASQSYQNAIRIGKSNVWTYLNLADSYRQFGDLPAAAQTLLALQELIPSDVAIRRRAEAALRECYQADSTYATCLADAGLLPEAQARMADAAAQLDPAPANTLPVLAGVQTQVRTVALVADMSLRQCVFYRVEQKRQQLAALGIEARVFDYRTDLYAFQSAIPFVEAVIFYRVPAFPEIVEAIKAARQAGLATLYEIDDLIFDHGHFPEPFEAYGGMISRKVYAGLVTGTGLFRAAMALCDYGIASTPTLATHMEPVVRSGRVFLHRNFLGEPHMRWVQRDPAPPRSRFIYVFYGTGTTAHNEEFASLAAPALASLIRCAPDRVRVVIMGEMSLPPALVPHADKITLLPPTWDVDAYWTVLSTMDISLAVLKPSVLNDCKSEIKWLEAAMLGVPSIVSATATYDTAIDNGVDGIVVSTPEDWLTALESLIHDEARRRRMGKAAFRKARELYGPEAAGRNLAAILGAICVPRPTAAPRLRVLIVNVFYPPQAIGGATRVVADNVEGLVALYGDRFEIEVFTTIEGGSDPYSLHTYRQDGVKVTGIVAPHHGQVDRAPLDPKMEEAFGTYLDHFRPDVVHVHCVQRLTASICLAALKRAIPYLVTVHDGWWISDHQFLLDETMAVNVYDQSDPGKRLMEAGPAGLLRMQVLASTLRSAARVLAVSEPFATLYRSCGLENVSVVENGVSELTPLPRTRSHSGKVRLGHVGGASLHKGYNLIKNVFTTADFRNLELLVLDHALPPGVERTEAWGGTPVRFRARVAQSEVARVYAELDALLAPSIWPESYGLVAREALMAGCWVVTSDRGAIGGDVVPGSGFVIDVGGPDALRATLAEMDAHPDRYLGPIEATPVLRPALDQVRELADIYLRLGAPDAARNRPAPTQDARADRGRDAAPTPRRRLRPARTDTAVA